MKNFVLFAVLFSFAFIGCTQQNTVTANSTSSLQASVAASAQVQLVSVSFIATTPDGVVLNKTVSVEKGSNALAELRKVAVVETQKYSFGELVTSVENISQSDSKKLYWQYYWNGEFASVGLADFVLNEPGTIELRLEADKFGG